MVKIKKFILYFFMLVLYSGFVLSYGGSGTSGDHYTVSVCNDFHLINIDEAYTSKVYIDIVGNLDCNSFTDSYLINKTANGLDLNGNGFRIEGKDTALFYILNTNNEILNIGNFEVYDSTLNYLIYKTDFTTTSDTINFYNVTYNNVRFSATHTAYFSYLINSAGATQTLNIDRFYYHNSSITAGFDWGIAYETTGTADSIELNVDKFYIDNTVTSTKLNYGGLFGTHSDKGGEIQDINLNTIYFNMNMTSPTADFNGFSYFGRIDNIRNVYINNSYLSSPTVDISASNIGLFSSYAFSISSITVDNTFFQGSIDYLNHGVVPTHTFEEFYYNNDTTSLLESWSGLEGKSTQDLENASTWEDLNSDIWAISEGVVPDHKWIESFTPTVYYINCDDLDYIIYENSNLNYDVSCTTNSLFTNYTLESVDYNLTYTDNTTISGIINLPANNSVYNIDVCSDEICESFNITVTFKLDDVKPTCEPLPNQTIYEYSEFDLLINCSDSYTNISLEFISLPANLNETVTPNSLNFNDNVSFNSSDFDFTLYLTVTDERGNYNQYDNFYRVSPPIVLINESIKDGAIETTGESLIFIGLLFLGVCLFALAKIFDIGILGIFAGLIYIVIGLYFVNFSVLISMLIAGVGMFFILAVSLF